MGDMKKGLTLSIALLWSGVGLVLFCRLMAVSVLSIIFLWLLAAALDIAGTVIAVIIMFQLQKRLIAIAALFASISPILAVQVLMLATIISFSYIQLGLFIAATVLLSVDSGTKPKYFISVPVTGFILIAVYTLLGLHFVALAQHGLEHFLSDLIYIIVPLYITLSFVQYTRSASPVQQE